MRNALIALAWLGSAVLVFQGCGGDNNSGRVENTGSACTAPTQCYPNVDQTTTPLKGAVTCLSVTGGYCTHECTSDADCCAVPGECNPNSWFHQVCAPFQSTNKNYCFLSCNATYVSAAGYQTNDALFCQQLASPYFGCRSTGGGSTNEKVCLP